MSKSTNRRLQIEYVGAAKRDHCGSYTIPTHSWRDHKKFVTTLIVDTHSAMYLARECCAVLKMERARVLEQWRDLGSLLGNIRDCADKDG